MPHFLANHILVRNRTIIYPHTSISQGGSLVKPRTDIDRIRHGRSLERQVNQAVAAFGRGQEIDFVYLVFKSPAGFLLDLDKLEDTSGNIRLRSYKYFAAHDYYEATAYLNKRAVGDFLRKIEHYIIRNTPKGNPWNQPLIANIHEIRAATLRSFWQEPGLAFPAGREPIWWEIWLSRSTGDDINNPIASIETLIKEAGIQFGGRFITFPEHFVYLMKATVNEIGRGLLYSDRLAGIRKPVEVADFFTGQPKAGLVLYGDLIEPLSHRDRVRIVHNLERIKIIPPDHNHDPELYGAVTKEAVARGEVVNPQHKRVVCMAVSGDTLVHKGRPSSLSGAVDQIVFGENDAPNKKTVFFVAAGNIDHTEGINYPLSNRDASIGDPGQSFNAITVATYTLKDKVDQQRFPGAMVLAARGALTPCGPTSCYRENEWPGKPDIVMEGSNHALFKDGLISSDSLTVLSTGRGGMNVPWLHSFGNTSGAVALAARFAAILYNQYPGLWPESIRGLMVHSADWTPAMLENRHISQLSYEEKRLLIGHVGYGVPNMARAMYSANNSLSLIAERELKPYKIEGSEAKTDECHLFDLPWPRETLGELHDAVVKLKVTLSYFIEPNPNNKTYQLAAGYRSHGLRFKMIDRNEREDAFKARINRVLREKDYLKEGSENWILGEQMRNKGAIHKDIWEGPAIDLAGRNKIAVYPVNGWWRTRKKLARYNHTIRYSLIVTIEAPETINDIDIYTPVANMVQIAT